MSPLQHEKRSDPDRFSVSELIEEAERETRMRRHVYEKQVRAGRMTRKEADLRIDKMQAIARMLARKAHL